VLGQINAICKPWFGWGSGVICSDCINLTKWGIYVRSRAQFAQSHQRRFSRWLHNSRINVQRLYRPLIAAALVQWGVTEMTVIEDTTMLWDKYCLIRVSIQYRGRAIPLVWRVLRHGSSSVSLSVYQGMLHRAARLSQPMYQCGFWQIAVLPIPT